MDHSSSEAAPLLGRPRLQEIAAHLREHRHLWQQLDVSRVRLFGSVARDDAHPDSDVDVLIDFQGERGLFDLVQAVWLFEDLLGRRTDVVTEGALHPPLRRPALHDALDVMDPGARPAGGPDGHKRWRWRVQALLNALAAIRHATRGLDEAQFAADPLVQDAVLMNLLRLGEGSKFVPQRLQDEHPEVPWNALRSIRNLIAHDYFGIDLALLWHTVTVDLPALRPRLEQLLARTGED
ncbi:HepT-like ribonuclease domain-containing protein [Deinococcus sonorensis]|uniref:HepT-like ribonuclease domain-containing protein n=2 Tax=Deinococcus sonorensis TaxID=309891 RepID=A0AAU7UBR6_9DEIO